MKKILSILFLLIFPFFSCSDDNSTQHVLYPITTEYDNFTFIIYEDVTDAEVSAVLDSLNDNYNRIITHLRVSNMPQVTVRIWAQAHSNDFYDAMQVTIGQIYLGATGYTPLATEMRLLYNPISATEAVHEFAHLVSIALKSNISNNPRWLWEAIAQYESRMFDPSSLWQPSDLNWPGFTALNQYNSYLPYLWGYFISSFIIDQWGDDGFINIIRANGDVQRTFGMSEQEFGSMVENYVRTWGE
ncbi:MAG: hypothetical protein A2V66_05185 [Ignavibacteria bacterium RBG_13_36_8]|nr:MAG: hypothetical protein A2V66_05185 [Ignavibacteria bacterium RBG_13_36_8]